MLHKKNPHFFNRSLLDEILFNCLWLYIPLFGQQYCSMIKNTAVSVPKRYLNMGSLYFKIFNIFSYKILSKFGQNGSSMCCTVTPLLPKKCISAFQLNCQQLLAEPHCKKNAYHFFCKVLNI
jgi:hypothetical protein